MENGYLLNLIKNDLLALIIWWSI